METDTGGQFISRYSFCILRNPDNLGAAGAKMIHSQQRPRAVFFGLRVVTRSWNHILISWAAAGSFDVKADSVKLALVHVYRFVCMRSRCKCQACLEWND